MVGDLWPALLAARDGHVAVALDDVEAGVSGVGAQAVLQVGLLLGPAGRVSARRWRPAGRARCACRPAAVRAPCVREPGAGVQQSNPSRTLNGYPLTPPRLELLGDANKKGT